MPGNKGLLLPNRREMYIYWARGMYPDTVLSKAIVILSSKTVMILVLQLKKAKCNKINRKRSGQRPRHPSLSASEDPWALHTFFLGVSHSPSHTCLAFLPQDSSALYVRQRDTHEDKRPAKVPNCHCWAKGLWIIFSFSFSLSCKLFAVNIYYFNYQKR